jgi:hypothetical protein
MGLTVEESGFDFQQRKETFLFSVVLRPMMEPSQPFKKSVPVEWDVSPKRSG